MFIQTIVDVVGIRDWQTFLVSVNTTLKYMKKKNIFYQLIKYIKQLNRNNVTNSYARESKHPNGHNMTRIIYNQVRPIKSPG